ncbi:uroporphyrinogen-III synthase [Leucobacter ruminantium]|uniref:Uroporphyrinogen-III synthase n=1 Tax=Leucobacter ruminantium TaxID=1289170 RepID=A0A939LUL5_9MICO|nr:uroporphyrinogen-III synthase [Leucobacter ruminantium]MBO1804687.1 uroporphyrinogen-III synthase [Leucobacter ruminantium]
MTTGLAGRRILVPRGGAAGARWADAIRERGGEPIVAPLLETAPPRDPSPLASAVERWNRGAYDWLVVTSANGAHAFADAGALPGADADVAAVGPTTAAALRERGFRVALQPERDCTAVGLAAALLSRIGTVERGGTAVGAAAMRILLPVSELAGTEIETALARAGHAPERVTAYRTLPTPRDPGIEARVAAGAVDAVLVLSGSGADEAARRFGPALTRVQGAAPGAGAAPGGGTDLPSGISVAAIGAPTARALAVHGIPVAAVAEHPTPEALLDALTTALAGRPLPASDPSPAEGTHA